ncbi:RrF2 family transcriptional regulator [Desulfofundulus thermosubterraneus]|uniref:Transcriptional regulator, BadM/Rrf2 family n=1 Tax=Desulfofundulus thermosubterraneus DSM 16057 TaxID=1121432 RepID=A0A1M6MMD3_9FIRM|nr:Rrf2 family transcriptional regulator [Desulfofundulus thermosubterraneus]SHJ84574.1 transcriptional regulator, BadM/Rrf2 family [Desulfofundulus thermosubterraneus DSM 16057]
MRLNQATDYAFRAVLYLAQLPTGEVVEAQAIATQECIPIRFLLKILRLLTKAGIVDSYRGVGGGYALARPPVEITLLDVLVAVGGTLQINRCLVDAEFCSKQGPSHCPVHRALGSIQETLIQEFKRYNFAQLAGNLPGSRKKQPGPYGRELPHTGAK